MNVIKKILAVLLSVTLLIPVSVFAASSPTRVNLGEKETQVTAKKLTYNGKNQKNKIKVYVKAPGADKKTALNGSDYKIVKITKNGKKVSSLKNAGTYYVTIKGQGNCTGTTKVKVVVKKAKATKLSYKNNKTAMTYTAAKLKKNKTHAIVLKGVASDAEVTYSLSDSTKKRAGDKLEIVTKKGKPYIRIKKGIAKGKNYTIIAKVKGTSNYAERTLKIKLNVK